MSPEEKVDKVLYLIHQHKEFFVEFLKNQTLQAKNPDPGDAIKDSHYIEQWLSDRKVPSVTKKKYFSIINTLKPILDIDKTQTMYIDYDVKEKMNYERDYYSKYSDNPRYGKYSSTPKVTMLQNLLNKCIKGVLSPDRTRKRLSNPKLDIRVHDYVWREEYSGGLKTILKRT